MRDHAAEIIRQLVPGAELITEQNIELEGEKSRADLVYRILYKGQEHILDLELQTNADAEMAYRMLFYHVELHIIHRRPVISVVLFLFEASLPPCPFKEESGEEELLIFHYRIITAWTLDAQEHIEKGIIAMYTFLPAMRGVNGTLLIQALKEMEQEYIRSQFGSHLLRFRTILRRSTMVSAQDKQIVEDYMLNNKYDSLIDEDPEVQERVARGKAEGEIRGLQQMTLEAVKNRYPSLVELAEERVAVIRKPDSLRQLVILIFNAPDENTARWALNTFSAS